MYIYTYAVIIACSIVLMIILGLRHAQKYGIVQENIIDFMIFALPASIIGGRIYYVIFSWSEFGGDLFSIINIRQGGIAIYGAVIGAFLTVVIFSKVKKLDAIRFLDFGVPYLILAQGIGRWGNFVNQEVFGTNTTLPWGMTGNHIMSFLSANAQKLADMGVIVDPLMPVHPTFLYESLWNFGLAFFLFWLRKRMKYKGEVFLGYIIGYGLGRTFIEGLRTDSLMLGSFRVSQLLSIVAVAGCIAFIIIFRKKFVLYADDVVAVAADGAGVTDVVEAEGDAAETEEGEDAEPVDDADAADATDATNETDAVDSDATEASDTIDDTDAAEEIEVIAEPEPADEPDPLDI